MAQTNNKENVENSNTYASEPGLSAQPSLTRKQLWDITFLVLAFACVVSTLTLVVGTGAVVILSVGGSPSVAPFSLAIVFMGMSLVSLTATHWIFAKWGRKIGFWVGCAIGIVGVLVGCWGLVESSPAIVLLSQGLMGGALGMGMYVRFSAVEVVPSEYSSRAVAWVLGGGCLAAFIGPEASQATIGVFGDDNLTYVGTFVVAGCFLLLQAFFVGMVGFPQPQKEDVGTEKSLTTIPVETGEVDEEEQDRIAEAAETSSHSNEATVWSIVRQPSFLLPLGVAILSWAIMSMPMAIFRVTMGELGYTERQSLTVIEFHFLAMYAPGFWSGPFIKEYGPIRACQVGIVCFALALAIHLSIQDNNNSTAAWFLGLILIGVGWNFGFSSATVWSTQSYEHALHLRPKIQAANECAMFLLSGTAIFSTGYLYQDAGGGGISGWRLLNGVLFGLVALYTVLVYFATRVNQSEEAAASQKDEPKVKLANAQTSDSSAPQKSQDASKGNETLAPAASASDGTA